MGGNKGCEEQTTTSSKHQDQIDVSETLFNMKRALIFKQREEGRCDAESKRRADQRHVLIMRAMSEVRKALKKTVRTKLGRGAVLRLDSDDIQGWPRFTMRLAGPAVTKSDIELSIVAHDKNEVAILEINHIGLAEPELVQLFEEVDAENLATLIRFYIEQYVDIARASLPKESSTPAVVAAPVELAPEPAPEPTPVVEATSQPQQKQITTSHDEAPGEEEPTPEVQAVDTDTAKPNDSLFGSESDFYSEDYEEDVFDKLPEMEEVEALPDLF